MPRGRLEDGRRFARRLAALGVFALCVRIVAVLAIGSYRLEHVTYEHGEIAQNLVEGRGFTVRWLGAEGPTSQQAPVYPAVVAAFYWMFGVQSPTALLALQIFQACLGSLLPIVQVLLLRELVPSRTSIGWLAGLGVACYPTLVYAATQVQVATLVSLFVIIVLWTAARVARTGHLPDAISCGAFAGLLVLTDPIMVLVLLVAVGMIIGKQAMATKCRFRIRVPGSLRAGVVVSAFLAIVAPWIMRNYLVHGELVFVKSTFGYAFWQGNHRRSFGTDKIPLPRSSPEEVVQGWGLRELERSLWRTRLVDTLYIDDAVLANERIEQLGQLSEPQRSRELLAEAAAYIGENPSHYVRLCLQRLRYFLLFDETNPKSAVRVYRLSHLVLQGLAVVGLWLSRKHWQGLWPTYLLFVLITAFHSLTIVSARFHLPLEPIEWMWAGFACQAGIEFGSRATASIGRYATLLRDSIPGTGGISSGLSHCGRIQKGL